MKQNAFCTTQMLSITCPYSDWVSNSVCNAAQHFPESEICFSHIIQFQVRNRQRTFQKYYFIEMHRKMNYVPEFVYCTRDLSHWSADGSVCL